MFDIKHEAPNCDVTGEYKAASTQSLNNLIISIYNLLYVWLLNDLRLEEEDVVKTKGCI